MRDGTCREFPDIRTCMKSAYEDDVYNILNEKYEVGMQTSYHVVFFILMTASVLFFRHLWHIFLLHVSYILEGEGFYTLKYTKLFL